ncbi:ATP-dependent protease ClpP, protease subunit [Clostridium sp. USBA 49]|uniref:head maturation protease, ClpP-related n=1 Tax=Clostridium sp. USBA 49 TaxID=1881060 RepID=UPI0009993D5A|nr:head maturation protease, ClpP-related [Clostridium sp. USBA 49]SKA89672.1 ATP-dependent protease ClpP, protease subunit [Clostridium sp. USBA 49]
MTKKINVKGDIVSSSDKWIYDWLGIEATSPKDIIKALDEANGQDIEVDINSGGGDIFAGSEIYTALRSYRGNVQINIVGLAASAASVISMAGKSRITPTGLFMIHNVSGEAAGDYRTMDKTSDILKTANQSIANAYKEKTGLSDEDLLNLMNKETWMSAEDAVKNKFVDEIMFDNQNKSIKGFYNNFNGIPYETIDKIRNLINKPQPNKNDAVFLVQKIQAQLNLLKLKGER